jgi:hypothetical protein
MTVNDKHPADVDPGCLQVRNAPADIKRWLLGGPKLDDASVATIRDRSRDTGRTIELQHD